MLLKTCVVAALAALTTAQANIDAFVAKELPIAFRTALANIGGTNGTHVPAADPGMVAASPSNVFPNYFYSWTRDSALTMAMIVDELIMGNASLQAVVEDYTIAQAFIQTVDNPSGTLWPAGQGLGEMKFFLNKTRFNEDWGRPQRDGPALRATVFTKLCQALILANKTSVAKQIYWPLILNDLKYVGQYWNQTGYELWEEVHGSSFFTLNAQHRALSQGAFLAKQLGVPCKPCQQAPQIICFLNHFWNATGGYITADLNTNQITTRSGINASPLISSNQVFDVTAGCSASDYQPCNSKMLATHKVFVDVFRDLYPINKNATAPHAVAVGRYPEDTYFEGNPWYICTLAAAEFLYNAIAQFGVAGSLTVDQYSVKFFKDIYPNATKGMTYKGTEMQAILKAMRTYADGFVSVVETYTPPNGSYSEQFNKTTGVMLSAYDLTWSLASFVTMGRRRSGYYPLPWGAMNVTAAPSTCPANGGYNSTNNYQPATSAGAPTVQEFCATEVYFRANISNNNTNPYLIGNNTLLGGAVNNKSDLILPMNPGLLNGTDFEWFIDIWLPAGVPLHYQYVLIEADGTLYFENTTHMVMPAKCGSTMTVYTDDHPHFPGGTK